MLDLYAGTGALGIEALSRGALKAVFVEDARAALLSLQENLRALHLQGGAAVIQRPVERAAAAILAHAPFDFVFADPPYAKTDQAAAALWELVGRGNLLAPFGRVIIEHARRRPAPEIPGLRCMETRAYGDTSISIYACEPT